MDHLTPLTDVASLGFSVALRESRMDGSHLVRLFTQRASVLQFDSHLRKVVLERLEVRHAPTEFLAVVNEVPGLLDGGSRKPNAVNGNTDSPGMSCPKDGASSTCPEEVQKRIEG